MFINFVVGLHIYVNTHLQEECNKVTKQGVKLFHRGGPYNPSLMNKLPQSHA